VSALIIKGRFGGCQAWPHLAQKSRSVLYYNDKRLPRNLTNTKEKLFMRIGFVELVLLLFIASITVGPNVALFVDRWLRRAQRTSAAAARRKL
jgi:hypothetical protein